MVELRTVAGPDHAVFLIFHIILVVTWLGMDIGVFSSSFIMRNASYPIKERLIVAKLASFLDMGPRASLLLMYPIGAWLSWAGGWGFQHSIGPFNPVAQLACISVVFLIWEFGVWWQYFSHRAVLAGKTGESRERWIGLYRRFDIYARWVLGGVLIIDGLLGVFGRGFIEQPWIAWKVLLFGLIIYQGIGIRWAADAFPALIQDIVVNGSTPEREAALSRAFVRAYPFVLILWGIIILISVLGIVK